MECLVDDNQRKDQLRQLRRIYHYSENLGSVYHCSRHCCVFFVEVEILDSSTSILLHHCIVFDCSQEPLNWSQISANLLDLNCNFILYRIDEHKKEADNGLMLQKFNQGSLSSDIYQRLCSQLWSLGWTNFDYETTKKKDQETEKTQCPSGSERRFSNCISYVLYCFKRIGYCYHFQVYRVIEEGGRATTKETVANSNNIFQLLIVYTCYIRQGFYKSMLGLPFFLSLVGVSVTTLFLFILSQCGLASSSMWLSKGGGLPEMEVRKSLRKRGFSTGTPRMARPE